MAGIVRSTAHRTAYPTRSHTTRFRAGQSTTVVFPRKYSPCSVKHMFTLVSESHMRRNSVVHLAILRNCMFSMLPMSCLSPHINRPQRRARVQILIFLSPCCRRVNNRSIPKRYGGRTKLWTKITRSTMRTIHVPSPSEYRVFFSCNGAPFQRHNDIQRHTRSHMSRTGEIVAASSTTEFAGSHRGHCYHTIFVASTYTVRRPIDYNGG